MEALLLIVALGFVVEATVETVKLAYEPETRSVDRLVAIGFGVAGCIVFGFNIFTIIGFPEVTSPVANYAAQAWTGLVVARGGNFVHDFLKRVQGA